MMHADISWHSITIFSLLLVLYAEIHFRVPGLFSRYYTRKPEIVLDLPHRLKPGVPLPVLLIVKDAHLFPVELLNIRVTVQNQHEKVVLLDASLEQISINTPFYERIFKVNVEPFRGQTVFVDVCVQVSINGKIENVCNDNYKLTSHAPFRVMVDTDPFPSTPGWYFGDMHCHTWYTNDQVEFGASLESTATIAGAMEMDFIAVTDHSYDLDDTFDNYLQNDPELAKWQDLWLKTEQWNQSQARPLVIPGEELSAGNSQGKNVHFLLLNNRHFFAGYGDSAEKWFRTKPRWSIENTLAELEDNALAIAAHPEVEPPFVQKLLIRRGQWQNKDYQLAGLHGVQMWNGVKDHFLTTGLKRWVELLLRGQRTVLFGGNDAHGNFNRFRQLSIPFLTMVEKEQEIFGQARTGVFVIGELTLSSAIAAMKQGRVIVTDGPFASLSITDSENNIYQIGDTFYQSTGQVTLKARSTPAFGKLLTITLYSGDTDTKKEKKQIVFSPSVNLWDYEMPLEIQDLPVHGYLRLAVETEKGNERFYCITNPVFLKQD